VYATGEELLSTAGRQSVVHYGTADEITEKFTGKELDVESGLDFFGIKIPTPRVFRVRSANRACALGARYFSGTRGRWTIFLRAVVRFLSGLVLLISLCGQLCSQAPPLAQAQALLKLGKAREALELLLDLRRVQPSDANVCQQIGIAYTQLNNLTSAFIGEGRRHRLCCTRQESSVNSQFL